MSIKIYDAPGAEGIIFPSVSGVFIPPGAVAVVTPRQTHTAHVAVVEEIPTSFPNTDALVTLRSDICLGVRTADCVPVIFHAPDIRAVAAVHAGWKGTAARIVANTIMVLSKLGADSSRLHMAIGPHICGSCYEVSDQLAESFSEIGLGDCIDFSYPKPHIDLGYANRLVAIECGINPEHISDCGLCTLHSPGYPSWRRCPGITDRLLTTIRLVKEQ